MVVVLVVGAGLGQRQVVIDKQSNINKITSSPCCRLCERLSVSPLRRAAAYKAVCGPCDCSIVAGPRSMRTAHWPIRPVLVTQTAMASLAPTKNRGRGHCDVSLAPDTSAAVLCSVHIRNLACRWGCTIASYGCSGNMCAPMQLSRSLGQARSFVLSGRPANIHTTIASGPADVGAASGVSSMWRQAISSFPASFHTMSPEISGSAARPPWPRSERTLCARPHFTAIGPRGGRIQPGAHRGPRCQLKVHCRPRASPGRTSAWVGTPGGTTRTPVNGVAPSFVRDRVAPRNRHPHLSVRARTSRARPRPAREPNTTEAPIRCDGPARRQGHLLHKGALAPRERASGSESRARPRTRPPVIAMLIAMQIADSPGQALALSWGV